MSTSSNSCAWQISLLAFSRMTGPICQSRRSESFYITAMGCEDGFTPQGLQAAGAGGL
jgi:hypothetical protein